MFSLKIQMGGMLEQGDESQCLDHRTYLFGAAIVTGVLQVEAWVPSVPRV